MPVLLQDILVVILPLLLLRLCLNGGLGSLSHAFFVLLRDESSLPFTSSKILTCLNRRQKFELLHPADTKTLASQPCMYASTNRYASEMPFYINDSSRRMDPRLGAVPAGSLQDGRDHKRLFLVWNLCVVRSSTNMNFYRE